MHKGPLALQKPRQDYLRSLTFTHFLTANLTVSVTPVSWQRCVNWHTRKRVFLYPLKELVKVENGLAQPVVSERCKIYIYLQTIIGRGIAEPCMYDLEYSLSSSRAANIMRMIGVWQSCPLFLVTSEGNGMNSIRKAALGQPKVLPGLVICLSHCLGLEAWGVL